VDLVVSTSLQDAERRLRLERFDLVVADLFLPDSPDEEVTVTRVASMGIFRLAVVSASDRRQTVVDDLVRAGADCAPQAISKSDLDLSRLVREPQTLRDLVDGLMGPERAPGAGGKRDDGRRRGAA
jgi:DNA-binding NarL/FixJ family response regulator